MIPDEIVERVRESADIVQIIGEYVQLRKTGSDYRGPCPFHQGTHRNFSVTPSKNIYYCFVCGEGGDVFTFLRKRLGLEWPEAVRLVAAKVGIEIPEQSSRRDAPDSRAPFWEVNNTAAEYFARMLWDDPLGAEARAYLESRNFSREIAQQFGLGFAPREIGLLREHMAGLGFDEHRLLEAGLLVQRDEGTLPRPRFAARLMFPIFDVASNCTGFGGRLLGPGEPKYLNSSDSPVFSKGKLLYGLNAARGCIRREERAYVVEGYFDVVRLVAAGIENVVAPLGTAMTPEQAILLRRYTRDVTLVYDSDKAGLKATFRAGDALLAQGASVRVVTLPPGEDPDSFVLANGREGLERLAHDAMDVFERKVRLLEQRGLFSDLSRRRRALDYLIPTIRATVDPLTRDLYVTRASDASGARKETILREVEEGGSGRLAASRSVQAVSRSAAAASTSEEGDGAEPERTSAVRSRARTRGKPVPAETSERAILAALLQVPTKLDLIAERLGGADFLVPEHRVIYEAIVAQEGEATAEGLERILPANVVECLQEIIEYGQTLEDLPRTIDDSLNNLESRKADIQLRRIQKQMSIATDEEFRVLLAEKNRIRTQQRRLGVAGWNVGKRQTMKPEAESGES